MTTLYVQFTSRGRSKRVWTVGFNLGSQMANASAALDYAFKHNADPEPIAAPPQVPEGGQEGK